MRQPVMQARPKPLMLGVLITGLAALALVNCNAPSQPVATGVFAIEPEWVYETSTPIISTPAVADEILVVRTETQVIALDATTRKLKWVTSLRGAIYDTIPPLIATDVVVVPEGNPYSAFDLHNGKFLWRNCTLLQAPNCNQVDSNYSVADLIASKGIVVVSSISGLTTAYNTFSGQQLWQIKVGMRGGTSLASAGDVLYLDANYYNLQAVDLVTGSRRWQVTFDQVLGRIAAQDGAVYLTYGLDQSAYVVALNADRGTVDWKFRYDELSPTWHEYLSVDQDTAFAVGDYLTAISLKSGIGLWQTKNIKNLRKPVVFNNLVLVRDNQTLYAFDKQTGKEVGQISLELVTGPYDEELNPAIYGDLVLIPVGKTRLAAYRLAMPN